MLNLFSIFDPYTSMLFSMNWLGLFLLYIMFPINLYFIPSILYFIYQFIFLKLFNEFKLLIKSLYSNMMFVSLLYFIFILNFFGLFPYIFTLTSHMVLTMTFSLLMWGSGIFFGWINHSKMMFCHLVPMGTPVALMSFMVIIESVSQLIRPLTLSIRLSANMIAGHLLLCLIGSLGPKFSILIILLVLLIQISLYTLELAVSLIQSYVFSVLCVLYSNEVEH
uniref:ATP synthase subunit a n=1 Tax=Auplopus sp. SJW-2017 TaxID=1940101 RepID=A0A1P8VH90_9HYME|nr:ATP synthase F0 subunit 6 [Auplopus sp. SJW-2017]